MALPSISTGLNAWMPSRCSVGARLSITGRSLITSSRIGHTSGADRSTIRLAARMFGASALFTSRCITKGLNSSSAIRLGSPHSSIFSSGPTTMTDRPE